MSDWNVELQSQYDVAKDVLKVHCHFYQEHTEEIHTYDSLISHKVSMGNNHIMLVVDIAVSPHVEKMQSDFMKALQYKLQEYVFDPYTIQELMHTAHDLISAKDNKMTLYSSAPYHKFSPKYYSSGESKYTWDYFATTPPVEVNAWSEGNQEFSQASRNLPGVNTIVKYPCNCPGPDVLIPKYGAINLSKPYPKKGKIWGIVQHLNDSHKWTREKIADWLDELHDSGQVNLEFDVETISDNEINTSLDGWTDVGYTTDETLDGGEK